MSEKNESRDWELTCDHCDGSGHVFVERQVAERKTDVQEFKEECECCEGRGFTIAFDDIPGIAEYVRKNRPAPSAPGDAQDERQAFEADYEAHFGFCPIWDDELLGGKGAYINSNQRNAFSMWQHGCARASAPAAGDALDLPELNADLIDILGRPSFACIQAARMLRVCGVNIPSKAEAEQATVIHYLLGLYLKHGSKWAEIANEDLKQRHAAALAAQVPQQGEA